MWILEDYVGFGGENVGFGGFWMDFGEENGCFGGFMREACLLANRPAHGYRSNFIGLIGGRRWRAWGDINYNVECIPGFIALYTMLPAVFVLHTS